MPTFNFNIGPFSSIYVGLSNSSDVLTPITAITTGPITFVENTPEAFLPGIQTTIQSGQHEVSVNATFYNDDDLVLRLARGLDLLSGNIDDPPEFNTYSLLLLHPDENIKSSYYLPQVRVVHNISLNYEKTRCTEMSLTFTWQDRNRYNRIYYQDTYDNLAAIMGFRSPI